MNFSQHAGDPIWAESSPTGVLVGDLLAPAVRRDLGLADFNRNNRGRWRKNFAKLKPEAENAKFALSRAGSVELAVDLDDGSGGTEPFGYTLTRGVPDDLALPFYTRAVRLRREALADSSLRPDHIDRLLLVGGATLSPGRRELLEARDRGRAATRRAEAAEALARALRAPGIRPQAHGASVETAFADGLFSEGALRPAPAGSRSSANAWPDEGRTSRSTATRPPFPVPRPAAGPSSPCGAPSSRPAS
ncbi:Hsp70 family protein [Streptomyces mutabilis]|uniref:Hsp70 family protein n=1 Tax=Streptomyces mutabilis TaxID=67332 RepID=UPI00199FAB2B|nr:Hsp70 family protein [Streptomyces mutabilis]GGQ41183.1 hypothetical protein GCM10010279_58480 [Streptomyces mutabilis]